MILEYTSLVMMLYAPFWKLMFHEYWEISQMSSFVRIHWKVTAVHLKKKARKVGVAYAHHDDAGGHR